MPRLLVLLLLPFAAIADDHPLTLWLAEGEQNRVYILGSVHLLRAEDHPLPSAIEDAYKDADRLYMEVDMDDIDPLATQALINRLGLLTDGRTLRDLMGDELYAQAAKSAEAMDIPISQLARTEPWLAAITVEQLSLMRIGFNPAYGIEMYMTSKAQADGKDIAGFESIEEQLSFLDGLSMDAQRELLLQTLDEGQDIEALMDELIAAWRHGDLEFFRDTLLEDIRQYPELYAVIVADRNHRWVDRINELLTEPEDYLVVVGALHLVGDDGVPLLLAGQGVEIQQLQQTGDSQ